MATEATYRSLQLKFDADYEGERTVYVMEHKTSTPCPQKPLGRTLYLTCVPPWATAPSLKSIFEEYGPVQEVYLEKRPHPGPNQDESEGLSRYLHPLSDTRVGFGFRFAYVVYKNAAGMRKALSAPDLSRTRIVSQPTDPIPIGIRKWKIEYNSGILLESDIETLKAEIKDFTDSFDKEKDNAVKKAEEEAEPDEDGWVTVSRHTSKKPVVGRSEKVQMRLKAAAEKKRKRKELDNFYKFQMKDAKLKRIEDLKSKFETDKQKQIKMKQDRKFKPY